MEPRKGHRTVSLSFLSRSHKLASHFHKLASRSHMIVSCYHKLVSCYHKILFHSLELASCFQKIPSHSQKLLIPFHTTGGIANGDLHLVPVLGSLPGVRLQNVESVVDRPKPYASHGSFKMFQISASELGTLGMHRRMRACADEFLATVTEGVVHNVYKVVIRSSFAVVLKRLFVLID